MATKKAVKKRAVKAELPMPIEAAIMKLEVGEARRMITDNLTMPRTFFIVRTK